MKVFSIAKGFYYVRKHTPVGLPPKEIDRQRAVSLLGETGDVPLACRTFGMSRAALYRRTKRFDPNLNSLKDSSRRPHSLRKPLWCHALVAVRDLRRKYIHGGAKKSYTRF
jgi:hypothetical protein